MPHFGLRTDRYKLIKFYGDGAWWELYDLQTDSLEITNLYGRPGYEKITSGLKEKLKTLMLAYGDKEALQKMMDGN